MFVYSLGAEWPPTFTVNFVHIRKIMQLRTCHVQKWTSHLSADSFYWKWSFHALSGNTRGSLNRNHATCQQQVLRICPEATYIFTGFVKFLMLCREDTCIISAEQIIIFLLLLLTELRNRVAYSWPAADYPVWNFIWLFSVPLSIFVDSTLN
jgi:hypothetical protein